MEVKKFYQDYHDRISDKRWNSPYPLRRYVHRANYAQMLRQVQGLLPAGGRILDAGCGDGLLAWMIADSLKDKQVQVFGTDISRPNIAAAIQRQRETPGLDNLHYLLGDAEKFPFADSSFDLVISSHVLEHLPNFEAGLSEIWRLSKQNAIIALPTCLNACAMVLLGGDNFWMLSPRSLFAFWVGLLRVISQIGKEGVNEGYAGRQELPHLWRYPWKMRRSIRKAGFSIEHFEAQTLCFPYLGSLIPSVFLKLQSLFDRLQTWPLFREFGYGSLAVVSKRPRNEL
jgi:ubiquinone/menaquinone biosynthesis C-methylase UbiE